MAFWRRQAPTRVRAWQPRARVRPGIRRRRSAALAPFHSDPRARMRQVGNYARGYHLTQNVRRHRRLQPRHVVAARMPLVSRLFSFEFVDFDCSRKRQLCCFKRQAGLLRAARTLSPRRRGLRQLRANRKTPGSVGGESTPQHASRRAALRSPSADVSVHAQQAVRQVREAQQARPGKRRGKQA